jgi:H+-transporting ATPase
MNARARREDARREAGSRQSGQSPTNQTPSGSPHAVRDQRVEEDARADRQLGADADMSGEQAVARLERYGPNTLVEERPSVLLELLSHFWAPLPWMIEAAVVLTALTARWADFGIILALLLLNGLVGFWEEHQAANAIEALKQRLAKQARVKRDGQLLMLPAEQLVPGDLITAQRGDVIPADGAVLHGSAEADEPVLTGESLPVEKQPGAGVFSGTILSRGMPTVRVLATGSATEFGRTAELTGREGLIWILILDQIKLIAYRRLDHAAGRSLTSSPAPAAGS